MMDVILLPPLLLLLLLLIIILILLLIIIIVLILNLSDYSPNVLYKIGTGNETINTTKTK